MYSFSKWRIIKKIVAHYKLVRLVPRFCPMRIDSCNVILNKYLGETFFRVKRQNIILIKLLSENNGLQTPSNVNVVLQIYPLFSMKFAISCCHMSKFFNAVILEWSIIVINVDQKDG